MYKQLVPSILIILVILLSIGSSQNVEIPGLIISISYANSKIDNNNTNTSIIKTISVYQNNTVNNPFVMDENALDCRNLNVFMLNQSQDNSNYTQEFVNFTQPFHVQVFAGYGSTPTLIKSVDCANISDPKCIIPLSSNCTGSYSNNLITSNIYTMDGTLVTDFKYYIVCSYHTYELIYQIQWGLVFIVLISIFMMFTSSKFQQAQSYSNFTLYINYYVVAIYSVLCMTKFMLIYYQVPNIDAAINVICMVGTVVFGILSSMLCFSQACYATKIKFFRWGIDRGWVKWRVMDAIGVLFGIGLLCLWYFLYTNWITSDIIFVMIYLSMMKIVKFGSLRIAILIIVINFIIDCIFYQTIGSLDNTYQNSQFYFYNNPLFLITPNITHIPNRKCTWYSVITMSFAGLLCAYLQRFDKNKQAVIYCPTFVVCYSIGAFLWLVISIFVPFSLPYDLFTVPGAIILLVIFANRRGQLKHLWRGNFYDQQKDYYNNQKQISQQLKSKGRNSVMNKSLFDNLKYQQNYSVADTTKRDGLVINLQSELKQVKEKRKTNEGMDNQQSKQQVQRGSVWKSEMPRMNNRPPPFS